MADVTETSEDTELPTPGPWIVDYMDGGIYSAASGDPRDLRLIATLDLKAWEVQAGDLCPENRANARLIENAMPMKATLAEGAKIAARVVACWSSGDLAGAVNALEEWANGAAALVAEIEVRPHVRCAAEVARPTCAG